MPVFRDQIGRRTEVPDEIRSIVSLVPSQTELICDLGCEEALTGITSFCVHPNHVYRSRRRVGGTKNFDSARIAALRPDLIVCNKEENPKAPTEALAEQWPVWVSDVSDFPSAAEMIEMLGAVLGKQAEASAITEAIAHGRRLRSPFRKKKRKPSVLYMIWKDPYMAAGTDTFISAALEEIGAENVLARRGAGGLRYPRIDEDDLAELNPDFIFLSSEPYPFKEKHAAEFARYCKRGALTVNGEVFSWYGSRIMKSEDDLLRTAAYIHGS